MVNWSLYEIFFYGSTALVGLGRFFSSLKYTVGMTSWTTDQTVARPLPTHRTTQTRNKRTQTSILWVAFEPTIAAFDRVKTVHTSVERAVTVFGVWAPYMNRNKYRRLAVHLNQRWPTGGPRLDLLGPPPSHRQVWFDWWKFQYLLNIIGKKRKI
jgi:hypothetical protein